MLAGLQMETHILANCLSVAHGKDVCQVTSQSSLRGHLDASNQPGGIHRQKLHPTEDLYFSLAIAHECKSSQTLQMKQNGTWLL